MRCLCRFPNCGLPALAWIALCAYDCGTLLGDLPGSPADDSVECFDSPEDLRAAYPDGEPEAT